MQIQERGFALEKFSHGFWHPFGAYAGLTAQAILQWKREEALRNGWTLWSFAFSHYDQWLSILRNAEGPVLVLCSHSKGATDPDASTADRFATDFRLAGGDWQQMPDRAVFNVTNPFKRGGRALAFKVANVEVLRPKVLPLNVEWYSKQEQSWRRDSLPTRGEYLIRRGPGPLLRPVSAVLTLSPPYLAEVHG